MIQESSEKREPLLRKMSPSDWPIDKPVGHFLDNCYGKPQIAASGAISGPVVLGVPEGKLNKLEGSQ